MRRGTLKPAIRLHFQIFDLCVLYLLHATRRFFITDSVLYCAKMAHLGLFFTILLVYVQNGWTLRCWSCSSDLDASCMDPFNATKQLQQRNYFQQVNYNNQQYQRNDMPVLRECSNDLGQIYNQKQMCVKRVLNVPYGKKIVSRECKAVSTNQYAGTCPDRSNNVEFCEYCDYDGCNGATGLRTSFLGALAVPCAMLLFFRR